MADEVDRILHNLNRLAAMREAAAHLLARDQLGRDTFARGEPQPARVVQADDIMDLLRAYARVQRRRNA